MDKQKIMVKYTKKVMRRLYDVDVYVFFRDTHHTRRGIFRDEGLAPFSMKDYARWKKNPKSSITFDEKLYSKDELTGHAWYTIVHEVSHFEEGIESDNNRRHYHPDKFKAIEELNLRKVDNLRKQFNKEVGLDDNSEVDDREDTYEEETNDKSKE